MKQHDEFLARHEKAAALAKEVGAREQGGDSWGTWIFSIENMLKLCEMIEHAKIDEREACADMADEHGEPDLARNIKARQ
jgi:hypothetical protein